MTRTRDGYLCPACGARLANAYLTRAHLAARHAVVVRNVEPWRLDAPPLSFEVWAETRTETAMEAAFRRAAA